MFIRRELAEERYRMLISVYILCVVFVENMAYNAFNVYCRELATGTSSLTGDRAQGDDSKHCANSSDFSDSVSGWNCI